MNELLTKLTKLNDSIKDKDFNQNAFGTLKRQISLSSTSSVQKTKESIVKEVIMMGFPIEAAYFAGIQVNYTSVDRIIEYLTERDEQTNLFTHQFVPLSFGKCLLC